MIYFKRCNIYFIFCAVAIMPFILYWMEETINELGIISIMPRVIGIVFVIGIIIEMFGWKSKKKDEEAN